MDGDVSFSKIDEVYSGDSSLTIYNLEANSQILGDAKLKLSASEDSSEIEMDFKITNNKLYFNLTSYVNSLLLQNDIKNIETIKIDTFDIKNKFFSARRAISLKHDDYGRNISIIMLN